MIKLLGKKSRNSFVAKGSLMIAKKLGWILIDLRSAFSLLEDSPLFLGTYINLATLVVGGFGVFFTDEKTDPKLVTISSSLPILVESWSILSLTIGYFSLKKSRVTPTLDPYWVIWLWIFLSKFSINSTGVILFSIISSLCITCSKVKIVPLTKRGGGPNKSIIAL